MLNRRKVWQPKSLQEAWNIHRNTGPQQGCFVSGGTWLRTQWEAGLMEYSTDMISLDHLVEMKEIIVETSLEDEHVLTMGSLTTLAECQRNPILRQYVAPLVEACQRIAAPSIRNQATIGGNILTIVGDTIPVLLIYHAQLIWYNGKQLESEGLEQWLIRRQSDSSYKENRILVQIQIPVEEATNLNFSFYRKIGRREAFSPSIVSVSGKGILETSGVFQEVTLAVAGGSSLPMRLFESEFELNSQPFSMDLLKRVHSIIFNEYEAIADAFTTATYKKMVAANVITSELFEVVERGGDPYAVGS